MSWRTSLQRSAYAESATRTERASDRDAISAERIWESTTTAKVIAVATRLASMATATAAYRITNTSVPMSDTVYTPPSIIAA
jgi:hypothetical protein